MTYDPKFNRDIKPTDRDADRSAFREKNSEPPMFTLRLCKPAGNFSLARFKTFIGDLLNDCFDLSAGASADVVEQCVNNGTAYLMRGTKDSCETKIAQVATYFTLSGHPPTCDCTDKLFTLEPSAVRKSN